MTSQMKGNKAEKVASLAEARKRQQERIDAKKAKKK